MRQQKTHRRGRWLALAGVIGLVGTLAACDDGDVTEQEAAPPPPAAAPTAPPATEPPPPPAGNP